MNRTEDFQSTPREDWLPTTALGGTDSPPRDAWFYKTGHMARQTFLSTEFISFLRPRLKELLFWDSLWESSFPFSKVGEESDEWKPRTEWACRPKGEHPTARGRKSARGEEGAWWRRPCRPSACLSSGQRRPHKSYERPGVHLGKTKMEISLGKLRARFGLLFS